MSEQAIDEPSPLAFVGEEDFASVDIEGPIRGNSHVACTELWQNFGRAERIAEAGKDARAQRVYALLGAICSFHYRADDRAAPYGPISQTGQSRSAIPSDLRGAQNDVLASIAACIQHPGLRARIADTVWLNDRKRYQAARIAVSAYVETIDGLLNGKLKEQFPDLPEPSFEKIALLTRAVQIASTVHKRGQLPDEVRRAAEALYQLGVTAGLGPPFEKLARLLLAHELVDPAKVATDAEALALAAPNKPNSYPLAIKAAWDCAADTYEFLGRNDDARRCRLLGIEQTIAMRTQVSGAAAEAHWICTAIAELRNIPGTTDRREELRLEMRALQERSVDEIGSFEIPLDLGDMRSGVIEIFKNFTLPMALGEVALLGRSQPIEDLKKQALASVAELPLTAMLGGVHYDGEGKITAETSGAPTEDEPDEDWFKRTIAQNLRIRRHVFVGGSFDAARLAIVQNYPLEERHFLPITRQSPFVPATHAHTYALGFARLMQGECISAAHLLIPHLEHSVRYVLHASSTNSSKVLPDMLQEDRPLSALIDQLRPELERIFTAPVVYEMELLFTYRGGPALRHDFAHGKVTDGYCFSPDVIYACWFIYHLTCLPLLPYWTRHIAPAIEAECF